LLQQKTFLSLAFFTTFAPGTLKSFPRRSESRLFYCADECPLNAAGMADESM